MFSRLAITSFCIAPNVADGESFRERVVGLQNVLRESRNPGAPADRRNHGWILADFCFSNQPARERGSENAFMYKILIQRELAFGVEARHLGASPGAAWGAVERASPG